MTRIVISTHGELAKGLKKSVEFILGKQENLYSIPAYTAECPNLNKEINKLIPNDDQGIVFLTDIYGGSVNNEILSLIDNIPNSYLVCGVNMPVIIQLIMGINQGLSLQDAVNQSITAGKKGIKNCEIVKANQKSEFDSF